MSALHISATVQPEGDEVRHLWVVDGQLTFTPQGARADLLFYRQDPRNDREALRLPEVVLFGGRRIS